MTASHFDTTPVVNFPGGDTRSDVLLISESKKVCAPLNDVIAHGPAGLTNGTLLDTIDAESAAKSFPNCRLVLCEPGDSVEMIETAVSAANATAAFAPVFALCISQTLPDVVLHSPAFTRVCSIVDHTRAWEQTWPDIERKWFEWCNPFLSSRIEDAYISDVLQMIAVSAWTCVVRVDGILDPRELPGRSGPVRGCIYFGRGIPKCAWSTHHAGPDAVYDLLAVRHGTLNVLRVSWEPPVHNLRTSAEALLLAHAAAQDETRYFYNLTGKRCSSKPSAGKPVTETSSGSTSDVRETGRSIESAPSKTTGPDAEKTETSKKDAIHAPAGEYRPKTLDTWWKNTARSVKRTIGNCDTRPFPLRWMNSRELNRLLAGEDKQRFIVLRGGRAFLTSVVERFARNGPRDKFDRETMPVLRIGGFSHSLLYLLGLPDWIEHTVVPQRCPYCIHLSGLSAAETVPQLVQAKPAVVVFLSDKAGAFETQPLSPLSAPLRWIDLPPDEDPDIMLMLQKAIELIAEHSSGGKQ